MKGLLKGLRYISQIFDDEKEPEMVIGFPTDVKHVAHIGMDGPSNAPPSWMNEFKQPGTEGDHKEDPDSSHKVSESGSVHKEGSSRRGAKAHNCHGSPARDLPEVPKPSRRHSSTSTGNESPTKAKSEKHRHSRRASKGSPGRDFLDSGRLPSDAESESGLDSPRKLPDIPKKSRRKKSKDSGGSVRRSKATAQASPLSEELGSAPRHHSSSSIKSVEEGDNEKGPGAVS
ncbi:hypothetical protein CDL15_Pgr007547 [Punica granatum]|nr:hypothetical protein CDL15_Pgr007547 [Punica granatum]